ncbi:MAG: hypothetical protein B7Y39_02620 [Bdellovibrio sp. 28-41-41]|nr:MAG: hypothetical protein B7Y39_02620 [Bdellovibrio sp. 28-41-41]
MFNFRKAIFTILVALNANAGVFSEGVKFFDEEKPSLKPSPEKVPSETQKKPFSWNEQLNVENDQFFKEGDYMPPAPLVEAMRRPTKENILNFEKWQEMRNLLLQRYELARSQYIAKSGNTAPTAEVQVLEVSEKKLGNYHYIFYFESTCPSCHAMFQTINQMVQRGVYVEAIRVDKGDGEVKGLNLPWSFAKPEELKKLNLKAVPVLVAIDEKTQKAYQMTGRKSIKEILKAIKVGSKNPS